MDWRAIGRKLCIVVVLLSAASGAHGQRVVVPSVPPKQTTLAAFAEKVSRHLETVGYTNVVLIPSDKGIHGSALRDGKRVQIMLDESGVLRTQDSM